MATKPNKTAGPADKGLQIVSRRDAFRRAGLEFGAEPRVIPLAELSVAQVEQLVGEPMLVVTEVDIKPAES